MNLGGKPGSNTTTKRGKKFELPLQPSHQGMSRQQIIIKIINIILIMKPREKRSLSKL